MEGQKKEKQIIGYFIKGGMVAVFFVGGFFMKIISLASTTFNIVLINKTVLSRDKAVFN